MIDVRDLTIRYEGSAEPALDGITIQFHDGEFVALMGANGSGKSTLARSLNGLLLPDSGEVIVDGRSTTDVGSLPLIRRAVGMVFQNPHLQITSLTVEREIAFGLQNLRVPTDEIRSRVLEQLDASRLNDARALPPRALSAGEQQRLALAAVLAMRPAYLVLDEATSLLSPHSRKELLKRVAEERSTRKMTVILITQFADEALDADRLVILDAGAVLLDGAPIQVLRHYMERGGRAILIPRSIRAGLAG
jgi:energy-coupling factor transporter ATP-binding protein EcfA2